MIEVNRDLKDIVICALRYALGRKTYTTFATSEFIMNNPDLIDERVCIVMLRDLEYYFEDRKNRLIHDDECDKNSWIALQNWLFKIARERNYDVVGYLRK